MSVPKRDWQPVRYCVETDTMAIEIRPWPGREDEDGIGRDAGEDLVIHYAPDGAPWLWEIEHASRHPEHIAAALGELQRHHAPVRNYPQRYSQASVCHPTFAKWAYNFF